MPLAAVAGIGAAGSLIGGAIQGKAASDASAEQVAQENKALDFQKQVYQTQLTNAQPYLNLGSAATSDLQSRIPELTSPFSASGAGVPDHFSFTPEEFQQDPGFKFALQQGQQAIENAASSQGGLGGPEYSALAAYTTGQAEQGYNAAYQRNLAGYQTNYANAFNTFQANQGNAFNRLGSLAGIGLTANNQAGQAGQNFGAQAGQALTGIGNAQAAGTIGVGNAINSGITGATSNLSNLALLGALQNGGLNSSSGLKSFDPTAAASLGLTG